MQRLLHHGIRGSKVSGGELNVDKDLILMSTKGMRVRIKRDVSHRGFNGTVPVIIPLNIYRYVTGLTRTTTAVEQAQHLF